MKFLLKLSYPFSSCFCSYFRFWLSLVFVFEIQLFCLFNNFGQLFVYFTSSNGISINNTSNLVKNVYSFNLHKKVGGNVLKYPYGQEHNMKWWKISTHLFEAKLIASALFIRDWNLGDILQRRKLWILQDIVPPTEEHLLTNTQ